MKRITLSLLCALLLAGCASTNIAGYSDPAYTSTAYDSVVVVAEDAGLERAAKLEGGICEEFAASGISCRPFHTVFSPTRSHSPDSVFSELQDQGVGALIVLLSGGNYSSSQPIGYQSFGSASVTGNQVQGQSTSLGLNAYSRRSYMRIVVVDASTRETAWLGDATTEGSGAVNVTDSAFLSSLTQKVAQELAASSHFLGGQVVLPDWLVSERVWRAAVIAGAVFAGLPLWRRLFPKDHHMQMGWMDWCGYYACIGAVFIIAGKTAGWDSLLGAGVLLLLPLYPIALLGILGKLDDTVTDIVRAIRRR